ncbi:MAG TPA: PLDc N-terminal domain-containing protein [Levilinea sp.]|nr:PLDc N-terminal domain-containing protein [Levilinea sp.]
MGFGYALVTLFNLVLLAGWLVLAVFALVQLRRANLPETARALWALIVMIVPFAGAIAFWIVNPGGGSS